MQVKQIPEITLAANCSFELEEYLPVTVRSQIEFSFQINIEKCVSNAPSKSSVPCLELKTQEFVPASCTPPKARGKNLLSLITEGLSGNPAPTQIEVKRTSKISKSLIPHQKVERNPPKRTTTLLLEIPVATRFSSKNNSKRLEDSPMSSVSELISDQSSRSIIRGSESSSPFNLAASTPNSNFTMSSLKSGNYLHSRCPRATHVTHTDKVAKSRLPNGDIKLNQYIIKNLLGCGAFGKVFRAINEAGEVFAIKVYNKRLMRSRWVGKRRTALSLVYSEIQIMESANHENLIKLIEVIDKPEYHKIFLVLEYAAGNSLIDRVPVSEEVARNYFCQLIVGLEYLHDTLKVVHRDIKPQNLLLDHEDQLKICDFGAAQLLENGKDEFTNSAGTYAFMAPELHGGARVFKGTATDVWAAGITLFYMLEGRTPYHSRKSLDLSEEVRAKDISIPSNYSKELRELFLRIFDRNPDARATLAEIKASDWLNLNHKD